MGLGPTFMTLFNHLSKDPVSKHGHILGVSMDLGWGSHSSAHNFPLSK